MMRTNKQGMMSLKAVTLIRRGSNKKSNRKMNSANTIYVNVLDEKDEKGRTVDMRFINGEHYTLKTGDVLEFDARVEHNVIATVKSKAIVTICF